MNKPTMVIIGILVVILGFLTIYSQQHDMVAQSAQGHKAAAGYGTAKPAGGYGAAPKAGGYGAPKAGGYGAPAPKAGGYGARAPKAGGYGAPVAPPKGGQGK